ncbi:Fusaric acid resistance protein family protein [Burkholderia sp. OK233]|nr:Fusaric acid resistance protein family protein [Burkholderia sp. OK233]
MSTPARSDTPSLAIVVREWARTDGLVWVFVFKTVLAALLSLMIAMRLELPQPRTAMTTVFIVMLPQSGMVIAKSFYRLCGTLVGLVATLALVALFAQQRILFLSAMALWIGFCTAGAARNRNFKSYGFVLAGYTAALIGIPAAQHPDGALISAMTRAAEVTLGIICSGFVSALLLPQYAGEQMEKSIDDRFSKFLDYVTRSLAGKTSRTDSETAISSFVADIVGFESARSVAVFENPDTTPGFHPLNATLIIGSIGVGGNFRPRSQRVKSYRRRRCARRRMLRAMLAIESVPRWASLGIHRDHTRVPR